MPRGHLELSTDFLKGEGRFDSNTPSVSNVSSLASFSVKFPRLSEHQLVSDVGKPSRTVLSVERCDDGEVLFCVVPHSSTGHAGPPSALLRNVTKDLKFSFCLILMNSNSHM